MAPRPKKRVRLSRIDTDTPARSDVDNSTGRDEFDDFEAAPGPLASRTAGPQRLATGSFHTGAIRGGPLVSRQRPTDRSESERLDEPQSTRTPSTARRSGTRSSTAARIAASRSTNPARARGRRHADDVGASTAAQSTPSTISHSPPEFDTEAVSIEAQPDIDTDSVASSSTSDTDFQDSERGFSDGSSISADGRLVDTPSDDDVDTRHSLSEDESEADESAAGPVHKPVKLRHMSLWDCIAGNARVQRFRSRQLAYDVHDTTFDGAAVGDADFEFEQANMRESSRSGNSARMSRGISAKDMRRAAVWHRLLPAEFLASKQGVALHHLPDVDAHLRRQSSGQTRIDHMLPSSDLLNAVHGVASRMYAERAIVLRQQQVALARAPDNRKSSSANADDNTQKGIEGVDKKRKSSAVTKTIRPIDQDFRFLDETVLLGIGVLVEELCHEALGLTGSTAFSEDQIGQAQSQSEQMTAPETLATRLQRVSREVCSPRSPTRQSQPTTPERISRQSSPVGSRSRSVSRARTPVEPPEHIRPLTPLEAARSEAVESGHTIPSQAPPPRLPLSPARRRRTSIRPGFR
ncbi:hypothetical protein PYCC9005_000224 [Savitreella phatthalungensis]